MRISCVARFTVAFSFSFALPHASALEDIAIQLNGHERLGQVFSPPSGFFGVSVIVPSWSDAEGGLTLSLWESPARKTLLARHSFTNIIDNAAIELTLKEPLPPGRYFWEIDQRTGETPIGLYTEELDADVPDPAYIDDRPDPRKRFRFRPMVSFFRFAGVPDMLRALQEGSAREDREDACRQLAAQGTAECIGPLAALLRDPELAPWARYALEPMPGPGADAALRAALAGLKGSLAIGVIQSMGARRDTGAVPLLREHLSHPDLAIAAAAADALGKIANEKASAALLSVLDTAPAGLRSAVAHGLLTAARRQMQADKPGKGIALFDELRRRPDLSKAIGTAALCGALEARGGDSVPLVMEILRGGDPAGTAAALGVLQQGLPGESVTMGLVRVLPGLSPSVQVLLVRALGNRGDPAALPTLIELTGHADPRIRTAVVQAVASAAWPQGAKALVRLVRDSDAEVAGAAEKALVFLPGKEADAESFALLHAGERRLRLAGIRLAGNRQVDAARQELLSAGRDPDAEIRLAVWHTLKDLAQPEDVPILMSQLSNAASEAEREVVEQAASAACGRAVDASRCAAELTRRLGVGDTREQASCLRLLAGLGDRWGRPLVLRAAAGENPELRRVACRLLSQWQIPDAAHDILRLAGSAPDATGRSLCLRASLRLAGGKGIPRFQAVALCQEAAPLIRYQEEKKLLLGVLADLSCPESLLLAHSFANDETVRTEAAAAVVSIAEALLSGPDAPKVLSPVESLAANPPSADIGRRAQAILAKAGKTAAPR